MKTSAAFILTTVLLAGNALAQGGPTGKGQPPATKPGMSAMDMNKQMSQMQENMKTMQAQMARMHSTTDPKERQKLMLEHMQSMRGGMDMMRGMGGPMMMGMMGGQRGAMGGGMGPGMAATDPKQREEMMERRMDMMQMMMDQLMQHQQMMPPAPSK